MLDFIKMFAPRVAQDLVTVLAGILAEHGIIHADQTQGFIGSVFFLVMLGINYATSIKRRTDAVQIGAAAVGADMLRSDARAIAQLPPSKVSP